MTSPEAAFSAALRDLHVRAGEPSSRAMAKEIGGISHTTLYAALRGTSVPSWPVTQKLVEHLGGDVEAFRDLWADTRPNAQPRRSYSGPEVSVFLSYARIDEKSSYGRILKLANDVANSYQSITGKTVGVFKDVESIKPGDDWRDRIRLGLSDSSILLAVISPAYLRSAACREELSEFLAFLDANSSTRLIIPLLFAASDRIANEFGQDDLWGRLEQLQWLDISQLRYSDEGTSSWMVIVDRIAERIDEVLDTPSTEDSENTEDVTEKAVPQISEGTLNKLAAIESNLPEMVSNVEKYGRLMEQLNEAVVAAAPEMQRADTFGKKLGVSQRLANKLTPIADEMVKSADQLVKDLREMTYLANTAVEQVRSSSGDLPEEAIDGLKSIRDMATVSIQAFSVIEEFTRSIEQVIGFSRELDRPLKKIQKASLNIASLRGTMSGWQEEVDSLRERYPDLMS